MDRHAQDEYARAASVYDTATAALLAPMRQTLIHRAATLSPASVLDICCGTGRQLLLMHRAGLSGVGADLSPAMLAMARAQCPPDIPLIRADATALPLPSASFGLCTIAFALHEKPRPVALGILHEAARVLTPEGTILALDYEVPDTPARKLGHLGIALVERLAGREHHGHYRAYLNSGGLPSLADEAGLSCNPVSWHCLGSIVLFSLIPR